jgi:hypothetical protein
MVHASQSFENELVRLFDLSLDAFCVAGFDGYLKVANPAFARIRAGSLIGDRLDKAKTTFDERPDAPTAISQLRLNAA